MDFEIVIDSTLFDLAAQKNSKTAKNEHVLSMVNDFEDGKWRYDKFQRFVWDNIAETALSHKEREALTSQPFSLLQAAAKNLRLTDSVSDIGKGSELAEIVLYGIMKHKYKALPVVPKIFYKQNTQDNAKGADSVHILVSPGNEFSLWFGEAKFYNSIEDTRLSHIIQSVKNSLATDKLKKENSIVTNVSDIDQIGLDSAVRDAIKASLSNKTSIDEIKSKINIPILLLHECELTAEATEMTDGYIASVKEYHRGRAVTYFEKQTTELAQIHKIAEIKFHLILFPVPQKDRIIRQFFDKAESHRA